MQDYKSRIIQGEEVARTIWGEGYGELLRAIMNSYDPAFTDLIVSFFGHTYARAALAVKERQICTLCALAALGMAPEMVIHFRGSLNLKWTQLEIRDALLMTVFTAGVPKTINAFKVFHDVLAELKIEPQTAPPVPDAGDDVYERGLQRGRAFMGEAWEAFLAPVRAFDEGAAGHLMGDVFGRIFLRPYLSDRIRALVLVASLTALENRKLLRLFLPAALRAGATREEIAEIIYQMHGYAGWTAIMDAIEVYSEFFRDKT